ncbi:MAG: hypothetical protein J1F05_02795 [Muribaculaceae bacterium]|nr:hypothetical protein [Muribaculaceae bacterium]
MEQRAIVAIEIASSKIKGAVGSVDEDGRLTVLAVEEISDTDNVRYGRVQNVLEVSAVVNDIIQRLESAPTVSPRKIKAMALSFGGRSFSATPTSGLLRFPHDCEITENHVARLTEEAKRDFVSDKNVEAVVPRMFYVNNAAVQKPVGIFGETLRGEFMMITCGKESRENLKRLKYDTVDSENVEYQLRHTAIADLLLSADDRSLGCALVDFGAETTTVSIYKDGSLAFLSTIPMGSRLITLDLKSGLGITEETAENHKKHLGTLAEEPSQQGNELAERVNEYVRARAGEIVANIVNQIECSGYKDLPAGIILVGGGAKLRDFATLLGQRSKRTVRSGEMPSDILFKTPANSADNIDVVALLAAAAKKDWTCLSEGVEVNDVDDEINKRGDIEDPLSSELLDVRTPGIEDDDHDLEDDKDDDDPSEPKSRGLLGFIIKGPKGESAPIDDNNFTDDTDETDDTKVGFEKTKKKIGKLRDSLVNLFAPPVEDNEQL